MTESVRLWSGEIPGYIDGADVPTLHYYAAKKKRGDGCVVIFPGGGYHKRAPHEGEGYAEFLNANGIDAFVVDYRVFPTHFPYPLLDARRAIRYVRANAEKYGVNPEKIAVMGSSAGGHLAALVSTYRGGIEGEGVDSLDEVDCMPNLQILCYPVLDISGHPGSFVALLGEDEYRNHKNVTPYHLADKDTPSMFLWHTSTDAGVDINNSFRYAERLHELGIQMEMHVYPCGGHGLGLAYSVEGRIVPYVQNWAKHLISWLEFNGYISEA